jgi:hypothetical protein
LRSLKAIIVGLNTDYGNNDSTPMVKPTRTLQLARLLQQSLQYMLIAGHIFEEQLLSMAPVVSLEISISHCEDSTQADLSRREWFIPFESIYNVFKAPSVRVVEIRDLMAVERTELDSEPNNQAVQ